jgi:hypothetical protein
MSTTKEEEAVLMLPPISDGYQYYDNNNSSIAAATLSASSTSSSLNNNNNHDNGSIHDDNNNNEPDVETPLAKLMNRGEYYRQLRKLIQEDERIRNTKDNESHCCNCCCGGSNQGQGRGYDYDVENFRGGEEKKDDNDDDNYNCCCCNCHHTTNNNNININHDYYNQDIIHTYPDDNSTTMLIYESYLKHQRYYDDLKHVDINYINYGTAFASSFTSSGEEEEEDVDVSNKQIIIQGRKKKDLIIEQRKYLGKGGLCWDAAFILGEHVIHNVCEWRMNNSSSSIIGGGEDNKRMTRVVELGAGTGLCGLMIAAAFHNDITVEITDLPELQDLMSANIQRNFCCSSRISSSDDEKNRKEEESCDDDESSSSTNKFNTNNVLCRVLQWGVDSDYINAPYDVIIGADVVTSIYDPIALAQTFYALSGPQTKIYISGKTRLDKPHEIFEMEMKRLFVSVIKIDKPNSRLKSPNVFVYFVQGKQLL